MKREKRINLEWKDQLRFLSKIKERPQRKKNIRYLAQNHMGVSNALVRSNN